jgi:serine/threonine protein kinase
VIRIFGLVDVKNEKRVIEKLTRAGPHRNIVEILRHGDLEYGRSTYYIDMELCDINLRTFIDVNWTLEHQDKMPYFAIDLPPRLKIAQLWSIMEDIASGLAFLHQLGEVHRDIKPENGYNIYFRSLQ